MKEMEHKLAEQKISDKPIEILWIPILYFKWNHLQNKNFILK